MSGQQIIAGIHGTRFASPWKALPDEKANVSPKPPRKRSGLATPSLRQLIDIDSPDEFVALEGADRQIKSGLLFSLPGHVAQTQLAASFATPRWIST